MNQKEEVKDILIRCTSAECSRLKCAKCWLSSKYQEIVGLRIEEVAKCN